MDVVGWARGSFLVSTTVSPSTRDSPIGVEAIEGLGMGLPLFQNI